MTTSLGKSCSFGLLRVPFVNCCQFMYLFISLLVLRTGCGIWLYQFLIIAYLFTFRLQHLRVGGCRRSDLSSYSVLKSDFVIWRQLSFWKLQLRRMSSTLITTCFMRKTDSKGWGSGLAQCLKKESTQGPYTVCSEFHMQCFLKHCPFSPPCYFECPEKWMFCITTWKSTLFYRMHFPSLNYDSAAHCPALENTLSNCFVVQASVPSWLASAFPGRKFCFSPRTLDLALWFMMHVYFVFLTIFPLIF